MNEYEIINNNKRIGKIKIFNCSTDFDKSILTTLYNKKYKKNDNKQKYIIKININNENELYNMVSKYKKENISNELDKIKKENNIKHLIKPTIVVFTLSLNELKSFGINELKINLESLFNSKIYFIKKVLETYESDRIKTETKDIIDSYNSIKTNIEYDFYTDEEKNNFNKKYITKLNSIIKILEDNTNYKYQIDFIYPIELENKVL